MISAHKTMAVAMILATGAFCCAAQEKPGQEKGAALGALNRHSVYVTGAEPGDALEIRIKKIVIKEDDFNFNLPGKQFPTVGLLASEFPEGHVQYFKLDPRTMTTEFKPRIVLSLKPFPGTLAVGPDPNEPKEKAGPPIHDAKGRSSTLRPGRTGQTWMSTNCRRARRFFFLCL